MSFITNISATPITGVYDQNGKPSGINEAGTTTSKFNSVTDATTNLVSSSYASGISNSSSYPFSNSGLIAYGPNMVTGLKVSSDSSNIAPNYSKGNVSTQLLTSLREGDWDRFNGWREPINSSVARGFATISPLETGVNVSSDKNVSPDRGNKTSTVSFLAPGGSKPHQGPIGLPVEDEDCNNCPYTLDDESPTYAPKIGKCDKWASEVTCFPEEFVTRSLFSGIVPAYNDNGDDYFVTGHFLIDWTYFTNGVPVGDYPRRGGPVTPRGSQDSHIYNGYWERENIEDWMRLFQIAGECDECIDDVKEKVGRNCTWGYHLSDATNTQIYYVGDSTTIGNTAEQSGIKWTGWCAEQGTLDFLNQTFFEVSPECNGGDPPITQLVACSEFTSGLFADQLCVSHTLHYINDVDGPHSCRCLDRYEAGFIKRSDCVGIFGSTQEQSNEVHLSSKILSDWDAIITSGSSNCSTMVNIVDPYTCSRIEDDPIPPFDDGEPKLYVPWPTGLTPEGSTISGGDVTGYAAPYWNDNYCDFVVGVREVVKVEADECADQGLNCGGLEAFQASGNVIEYPFYKLQVAKDIRTDLNYFESSTECIRANSPTPTGTGEDPCGSDCVWMWDGSDWYVSSSGENCLDCGTGPSSPGQMMNDVTNHPCDCS